MRVKLWIHSIWGAGTSKMRVHTGNWILQLEDKTVTEILLVFSRMQVSDEIKSCFREMSQNPDYIVLRSEKKVKNEAWIQANIYMSRAFWGVTEGLLLKLLFTCRLNGDNREMEFQNIKGKGIMIRISYDWNKGGNFSLTIFRMNLPCKNSNKKSGLRYI